MANYNLTRRTLIPVAAAAVATATASPTPSMGAKPDAELHRLWADRQARIAAYNAARERCQPARASFDAEFPPCPADVLPGRHWDAHDWLWRKHGLNKLSDAWNAAFIAIQETDAAIVSTPAEGLFGIGIKLSALSSTEHLQPDASEYEAMVISVLADIDRLTGSSFAVAFQPAEAQS
jgi:hypothetical protein